MNSIWTKSAELPCFEALEGEVKTDVLIIGGGMAGILCAYFLQKENVDYVLVEGKTICSGVTQNTTAKITSQHGLIYDKFLRKTGLEKTKMYLEANQDSVKKYYELCREIDCDFEPKTSFIYSVNDRKKLEKEADALHRIGFEAKITDTTELPFDTVGAIGFENQAQFHPLKFIAEIARNLKIYEHTFVKELKNHEAVTEKGAVFYRRLIMATHFPVDNTHGMYFLKMYQNRSYVIALKNAAQINGMYLDAVKNGLSFRNYVDFLLLGGGGHRTGKNGGGWRELRSAAGKYYPNSVETDHWAAQDCMTLDEIPYIGRYSLNTPDCFAATGFQKWGMTSSMTAALLLTDMIMERENPYQEVFSPSRCMLTPQLLINGWEALTGLFAKSRKRCPHMGCALKWNSFEHSWDCPCHGSRFDKDGSLLNNPANGDIKW